MWRNIYKNIYRNIYKTNIGVSFRLLCSLHLIDPSTILSKRLSIDTTLLESALKLKKFKGDTFRANEDILQPWQSPEILQTFVWWGGGRGRGGGKGVNLLSSIERSVKFRVFLELYLG